MRQRLRLIASRLGQRAFVSKKDRVLLLRSFFRLNAADGPCQFSKGFTRRFDYLLLNWGILWILNPVPGGLLSLAKGIRCPTAPKPLPTAGPGPCKSPSVSFEGDCYAFDLEEQ